MREFPTSYGGMVAIDAGFRQSQPFYWAALDEVLPNDLLNVAGVNVAVPDGFGIDNDHRAMLALVQATGLIGADPVLESGLFYGVLERRL